MNRVRRIKRKGSTLLHAYWHLILIGLLKILDPDWLIRLDITKIVLSFKLLIVPDL